MSEVLLEDLTKPLTKIDDIVEEALYKLMVLKGEINLNSTHLGAIKESGKSSYLIPLRKEKGKPNNNE